MTRIIDIDGGKKKANTRYVLNIILVVVLSIGIITGSILSLFFSKLDYIPNLIINTVVDILLVIFLVFYFFNIFPVVSYYHKLFKGMNSVALDHRRKMTFVEERETKTLNNVDLRVLLFSYKEGETVYEEHLFVLDSGVQFEPSKSYKLDTYQNIIVGYEELSHATIQ